MTNCSSGDQSPCQRTMEKLYEFLDGELTPNVDEQIRAHLAECRGCFPHFEYERVFLRFMEKRVDRSSGRRPRSGARFCPR